MQSILITTLMSLGMAGVFMFAAWLTVRGAFALLGEEGIRPGEKARSRIEAVAMLAAAPIGAMSGYLVLQI